MNPARSHAVQQSRTSSSREAFSHRYADPSGGGVETAGDLPPRFYSVRELAGIFGRSPRTVRGWLQVKKIGSVMIGNTRFVSEETLKDLWDVGRKLRRDSKNL
jgi:hypothetical protein